MTETDHEATARAIVDANAYMTIATADADGVPWASPVWFAPAGYAELYWVSRPEAQHSRNIEVRPSVAIVVFDSRSPVGAGVAVYMAARAERVTERDEIARGMQVFSRRSVEQGARPWSPDDVTGDAALRLFRATASEHWVLGQRDQRIPVDLR